MKEALAHALSGPISLAEDEWRERPVDRLHAIAAAQSAFGRSERESALAALGVNLMAFKLANNPRAYNPAIEGLAFMLRRTKPKPPERVRILVATQAITEWSVDFCPSCGGACEVKAQEGLDGAQRMKSCPECGGSGRRRYTDRERREAIGGGNRAEHWMADALAIISQAEHEAIRTAKRMLERY